MDRRTFSRLTTTSLASVAGAAAVGVPTLALLGPGQAVAQVAGLREGTDFLRLPQPAPVEAPAGQVEVVEFFAYSCVHCFNFEPMFEDWIQKKPAHVTVRRTPVAFNAGFEPMQRLYYTLEALNLVGDLHAKVFKAIHVDRQRLTTADAITAWVVKQGVDQKRFTDMYNSFGVVGKARRATTLQDAYRVEGTPALGIAGRYYVPGQAARTLLVANALIAEARKG
ncbi:MAG: thiol:disulfide interchange protein DsbA/DsbL [Serpentinimonas sp.]|nr:thiol:disulfide interchange protein DsbA/DsbL [Serpentinimonas sp.]